ncbi:MAG: diacylglycerol/polyprenol kinase family protein [Cyanobacteria bacterium P01_F01_bin.150]
MLDRELSLGALSPTTQIIAVAVWLGLVSLAALVGKRSPFGSPEVVRKIVHIGTGNVILLAWWFYIPAWIGIGASVLFGFITLASYWLPILPMINGVGRQSWGTFFYSMSIGLLITVFWPLAMPQYAVIGILIMAWGDGLAALIGQRWGQHPIQIWGGTKSLEGSGTMAVVSFIVSILVLWSCQGPIGATWGVALVIAILATVLELFSKFGIDNLTVPLGSGAIAFALNHLWLGL